jgi:peptidoglycan/LPS O-acetylase OafA/YrhL
MGLKYEPALDGLRAVAIIAVVGWHFARPTFTGGSVGVDVFFVLSGYLITSILFNEISATGTINYLEFIKRRAKRLLPGLAALLLTYAALAPLIFPKYMASFWLDISTAAFYFTNLRQAFWPTDTPLLHIWSLSVEEQFYIAWPFIIIALAKLPREKAFRILCVLWASLSLLRMLIAIRFPAYREILYYFTPLHATGLVVGSALATSSPLIKYPRWPFTAALLLTVIFFGHTESTYAFTLPFAEVTSAAIIAGPPAFLSTLPLRFLGKISYGVYLWHLPIGFFLGFQQSWPIVILASSASILAGWLSYILVERRFVHARHQGPSVQESSVRSTAVSMTGAPSDGAA